MLRRCIETIISKHKEQNISNTIQRSANLLSEITDEKVDTAATMVTSNSTDNLNHVKLSEEIKKMYDVELDKEKIDDLNDAKVRAVVFQHNYDSFHYAQNDPWVNII